MLVQTEVYEDVLGVQFVPITIKNVSIVRYKYECVLQLQKWKAEAYDFILNFHSQLRSLKSDQKELAQSKSLEGGKYFTLFHHFQITAFLYVSVAVVTLKNMNI